MAQQTPASFEFEGSTDLRIPFITADRRQREAARRAGLNVVWIGTAGHG
jgi:hypothetical protein